MAGEEQVYLSVVRQDIIKYDMMVKSLVQVSCTEHTVTVAHLPQCTDDCLLSGDMADLVWFPSEYIQKLPDD